MAPLSPPETPLMVARISIGSMDSRKKVSVTLQPFASTTVTWYSPGSRFSSTGSSEPLLQLNVYGSVPPEIATVMLPFSESQPGNDPPAPRCNPLASTCASATLLQPSASVTVTT